MKNAFGAAVVMVALLAVPVTASAQHHSTEKPVKNIVEVANEAGSFKTLVAAVQAAGLVETLRSAGPFTVFAPSDAAFARLPEGTVAGLLADKEKLTSILTLHVLQGKVMAGDVIKANGARPTTVNGEALDIAVRDGKVYVNGAQVTSADILASNGVIHVIDTVLLPKPVPAGAH